MKKITVLVVLLVVSMGGKSYAEYLERRVNKKLSFDKNDAYVATFNAAFSCTVAAIRTGIRTKSVKEALKSCGYGMLGGGLVYVGQKISVYSGVYNGLGWVAQLTNSFGVSLRDNAAKGIHPLSRFQYDIGPIRISVGNRKNNGGQIIQAHWLLYSSAYLLSGLISQHDKFNWRKTFKNGVFVFDSNNKSSKMRGNNFIVWGCAGGNIVFMRKGLDQADYTITFGHEIVHVLQYREMTSLSILIDLMPPFKLGNRVIHPFKDFKRQLKLDAGSDLAWLLINGGGYYLPHHYRPIEFIPLNVELNYKN